MKIIDLKEAEKAIGKEDGWRERIRAKLTEAYADLTAGTDDELRSLRAVMVAKHSELIAEFTALGDTRYSTPEGSEVMRDMRYYDELIRRIEVEMSYRMIPLKG